jgi:hypothetical protein
VLIVQVIIVVTELTATTLSPLPSTSLSVSKKTVSVAGIVREFTIILPELILPPLGTKYKVRLADVTLLVLQNIIVAIIKSPELLKIVVFVFNTDTFAIAIVFTLH